MRKLNRKGFTLVELLAVIIILAVVVGITIPAVLTAVSGAKESQFKTASETASDWFDRQYQAYMVGDKTISAYDDNFVDFCKDSTGRVDALDTDGNVARDGSFVCNSGNSSNSSALLSAAGLTSANIASISVSFVNGRSCVVLTSAANGDYVTDNYPAGSTSIAGGACPNLTPAKTVGIAPLAS